MLPALFFFFSCEEPSEIGLELNPNMSAVSTHYVEIPLETSQIQIDSLLSSVTATATQTNQGRKVNFSPILIGRNSTPAFGDLRATAFTNISTTDSVPAVEAGASVDSVFLRLSYEQAFSGQAIDAGQSLQVFRLQDAVKPTAVVADTIKKYTYFTFNSEELAEQIGSISFDTSQVDNNVLKIALSSAFANEILEKLKSTPSTFASQEAFNDFIKGLAIVPGEENTFINNYNLHLSGIELFYGGNTKPVSFPLIPRFLIPGQGERTTLPAYYHLETDYSNTALVNAPTDSRGTQAFTTTDGLLYFRSGVGLSPKISFSALESFINSDTLGTFVLNQATLEIDSVGATVEGAKVPAVVAFSLTDKNNKPSEMFIFETKASQYVRNQQDTLFRYRTDLLPALEQYIQTKDERFLQGMYSLLNSSSLSGFIADPDHIRLKIYYTSLKEDE